MFEIPIKLACYGLRRSEICSLTIDDLNGNTLTIDSAKALDKSTDNSSSQSNTASSESNQSSTPSTVEQTPQVEAGLESIRAEEHMITLKLKITKS